MSFFDVFYLIAFGFILILVVNTCDLAWHMAIPGANSTENAANVAQIDAAWNNNTGFFNHSFAAIFIMIAIIMIVLTAAIYTHPVILAVWLLINILALYQYDAMVDALVGIAATSMWTGVMAEAADFFASKVGMLIPLLNVLMALVMLGKRVFT